MSTEINPNSMKEKYALEETALKLYALDNYMEQKLIGDQIIITTDIAYWRIIYLPDWNQFALYHGNSIPKDIDPEKYVDADYHYQKHLRLPGNIMSLFIYITNHDDYRCKMIQQVESMPRRTKKQRLRYNRVKQKQKEYKEAITMQMIRAFALANAS